MRVAVIALLFTLAGASAEATAPLGLGEIEVCPGCPISTIGAAVAQARPGDRVTVRAGVYAERGIVIDRAISLRGDGFPVVDGGGGGTILTVAANGVRIQGFVVRNTGRSFMEDVAGIRVEGVNDCSIADNRVLDTFFGIYLAKTQYCEVRGNEVRGHATSESQSGNAIHLWAVDRARVADNRVSGHRDGIYLEFARGSTIERNVSEGNLRYGLHFMFSEHDDFRGNTFRANGAGVAVMYSRHIKMEGNGFLEGRGAATYGLLLKDINDSLIAGNRFRDNTTALYAEGSNRLAVDGNEFTSNGWAVRVMANSMGIVFAHNRFAANTFEVATNGPRSFNAFVENWWGDYRGYDLNRDGIGDVPHRPVRLFAFLVEQYPQSIILLRSPFVELLELAERLIPVLTPTVLADRRPVMPGIPWSRSEASTSPSAR